MYKKKIIAIVLILVLTISTIILSSCSDDNILETDYFRYHIFEFQNEEVITIDGLTKAGEQLKNIIIPEEIDGKKVKIYKGYSTASNVRKIIISYNVGSINSIGLSDADIFVNGYPEGLKILYVNCSYLRKTQIGDGYIATNAKEDYSKHINMVFIHYANMQYLFNYEGSQNEGVFFIDDLNINEQLEIIPEIPKREGFVFTGWYAEPECINEIELQGYTKKNDEIVYLYAGWQ